MRSQLNNTPKQTNQTPTSENSKRCFNCGNKDHLSASCPDKTKGTKCFKCGNFGHVSIKCTNADKNKVVGGAKTARVDAVKSNDKKTYKMITICSKNVTAIIDSGSDLHLIRFSLYKRFIQTHQS